MPLRVAAISFLNPAPLLYNFEHEPEASQYRARYAVHYTTPAQCAAELQAGEADLGLIPVAQLTPELAIVPGCTIASQGEVRSILLLVRCKAGQSEQEALQGVRSLAVDQASRSSTAYVRTMLRRFYRVDPQLHEAIAEPVAMLEEHDAALLIGDPALLARERHAELDARLQTRAGEQVFWIDLAALWRTHTGLPWVAAVWAVRAETLREAGVSASQLIQDLQASRDAGLRHIEELVREWMPRLPLQEATIRTYLTRNIHYVLDDACLQAIRTFRALAAEAKVLPRLPALNLLSQMDATGDLSGPARVL